MDPLDNPYGVSPNVPMAVEPAPAPGSGLLQPLPAAPSNSSLTPQDLDSFKWNNWSSMNRFEEQSPAAQRALVKMYTENVLPYVASATRADPKDYVNKFIASYPNVAVLGNLKPNEVQLREEGLAMSGLQLEGEARSQYLLSGDLPKSKQNEIDAREADVNRMMEKGKLDGVEEANVNRYILTGDSDFLKPSKDLVSESTQLIERRKAELAALVPSLSVPLTPQQSDLYLATGDLKEALGDPIKAAERAAKLESEDKALMDALQSSYKDVDNVLRVADKLLDTLGGVETNPETQEPARGDRGLFSLPVSGPLSKTLSTGALSGFYTFDANNARGYLTTLKSSAVFETLQNLRRISSDGSSGLGQVTNKEIELLGSRIAALDIDNLSDDALFDEVMYFSSQMAKAKEDIVKRIGAEEAIVKSRAGAQGTTEEAPTAAPAPAIAPAPAPVAPAPAPVAPAPVAPAPVAPPTVLTPTAEEWEIIMGGSN